MLRLVIVAAILAGAVVLYLPDGLDSASESTPAAALRTVRDLGNGASPAFRARLDGGASCAELISIRDTYDPLSSEVALMNDELDAIGCPSISSVRSR